MSKILPNQDHHFYLSVLRLLNGPVFDGKRCDYRQVKVLLALLKNADSLQRIIMVIERSIHYVVDGDDEQVAVK